jgi:hemolysin III
MKWEYDRAEVIADGIVHALGVALGVAGVLCLLVQVADAQAPVQITAALVYGAGLLTVLSLSAIYNLWPISPAKSVLRRFDHAAIYLLIACTYTPFLTHLTDPVASHLLVIVWVTAA